MNSVPDPVIADHPEAQRYEVRHRRRRSPDTSSTASRPGLIALIHTEIRDRFEGQGLGGRLVAFALDDARDRGLAVLPFCPFVDAYLQRHREYVDLVPAGLRANFDL